MSFRDTIRAKTLLLGTLMTVPSLEIAEILSTSPFDWLFLDLEHSAMNARDAQTLLQVVGNRKPCLIRVSSSDERNIRKALDSGAQGVILPQINSRQQLADIIGWTKFSPLGRRSIGLSRASGYGSALTGHLSRANEETAVVIQIEHIDAVARIDEILAEPGIDAAFIGPYDLSASMGVPGDIASSEVQDAIDHIHSACRQADVTAGIFVADAASANRMGERGFSLIAIASDILLLGRGISAEIQSISLKKLMQ